MTSFCHSVEVQAPAQRVWDIMSQPQRWPEWIPTFRRVALVSGSAGLGAVYRVEQPRLPPALMTVTDWQAGRGFTWASRTPLLRARGEHHIEESGPNQCGVRLELRFEGMLAPVAARLLRRLVTEYVSTEASALKTRAESS
jgi:hypothetical protein